MKWNDIYSDVVRRYVKTIFYFVVFLDALRAYAEGRC